MKVLNLSDEEKNQTGEVISWVPSEGVRPFLTALCRIDLVALSKGEFGNVEVIPALEETWGKFLKVNLKDFILEDKGQYVVYDLRKISAQITKQLTTTGAWQRMGNQYKSLHCRPVKIQTAVLS